MGIDAINFNDAEVVALEPEILGGKGSHVDDADHVGRPRLDMDLEILGIIHQSSFRNGFRPSWISDADKGRYQTRHLLMVPVRQG